MRTSTASVRAWPFLAAAAGALISLGSGGCTALRPVMRAPLLQVPGFDVPPVPDNGARVGVARVEITPPPGYPTGGHGPAGGVARGYSSRLWVRTFYLHDGKKHHVLLGSVDLFVVPGALHDLVAKNVADLGIAPGELILSATHTHQSPGNFTSAAVYNEFGSREGGFDEKLLDFLVARITRAVREAVEDARKNAAGPHELIRYEGRLDEILLNRAPMPFLLNPDAQSVMDALNPAVPDCAALRWAPEPEEFWNLSGCPRLRAVDRSLTLLEVRRRGARVGLLVFAATHPTVLSHRASLYSSDFVGQAVSTLESVWETDGASPVVAFFNGAEGDVVARRTTRDLRDLSRRSARFREAIESTLASGTGIREAFSLVVRHEEGRDVRGKSCAAKDAPGFERSEKSTAGSLPASAADDGVYRLSTDPTFGVATLGGGEGDRTILYDLGWREGVSGRAEHGQGPKLPGLSSSIVRGLDLTKLLAPPWKYPAHLPLSLVRIGSLVLAGVPVEMTTRAGLSVRAALGDPDALRITGAGPGSTGPGGRRVLLLGLTNDYASYVTTLHEYMAQDYAGASTIWGPDEASFIACRLASMDASTGAPARSIDYKTYEPGWPPTTSFGPCFGGDGSRLPDEENELLLTDAKGEPDKQLPWIRWRENAVPSLSDPPPDRRWRVRIHEEASNKWRLREIRPAAPEPGPPSTLPYLAEDDLGFNFVVVLMDGTHADHTDWAAIWTIPFLGPPTGWFRFEVLSTDGKDTLETNCPEKWHVFSKPFRPGQDRGRIELETCRSGAGP